MEALKSSSSDSQPGLPPPFTSSTHEGRTYDLQAATPKMEELTSLINSWRNPVQNIPSFPINQRILIDGRGTFGSSQGYFIQSLYHMDYKFPAPEDEGQIEQFRQQSIEILDRFFSIGEEFDPSGLTTERLWDLLLISSEEARSSFPNNYQKNAENLAELVASALKKRLLQIPAFMAEPLEGVITLSDAYPTPTSSHFERLISFSNPTQPELIELMKRSHPSMLLLSSIQKALTEKGGLSENELREAILSVLQQTPDELLKIWLLYGIDQAPRIYYYGNSYIPNDDAPALAQLARFTFCAEGFVKTIQDHFSKGDCGTRLFLYNWYLENLQNRQKFFHFLETHFNENYSDWIQKHKEGHLSGDRYCKFLLDDVPDVEMMAAHFELQQQLALLINTLTAETLNSHRFMFEAESQALQHALDRQNATKLEHMLQRTKALPGL